MCSKFIFEWHFGSRSLWVCVWVSVKVNVVAGEGPAVPGLPRSEILSDGAAPLEASDETGQ